MTSPTPDLDAAVVRVENLTESLSRRSVDLPDIVNAQMTKETAGRIASNLRTLLAALAEARTALALVATDEVCARFGDAGAVELAVLTNDVWAPAASADDLAPHEYANALAAWQGNRSTGLLRYIAGREGYPLQTWRGKTFDSIDAARGGEAGT